MSVSTDDRITLFVKNPDNSDYQGFILTNFNLWHSCCLIFVKLKKPFIFTNLKTKT
jgi:hypothetical protein